MLNIELHITCNKLNSDEIKSFEDFCHSIDAKPIIILLSKGESTQQPMISKIIKCQNRNDLKNEIEDITEKFESNDYSVTRIKMEVAPWDKKEAKKILAYNDNNYFEWHGKVKIEDEESASSLISKLGGHISRNVLKRNPKSKFITLRDYGTEEDIKQSIHKLKQGLNQNGIAIIKEELEYCIYDSNVTLDKGWI